MVTIKAIQWINTVASTHIGCSEMLLFSISYLAYLFMSTASGKIDADGMLVAWENDGKGHILKCLSYSLLPCSNQPVRLSYPPLSPAILVPTNKHISKNPLEIPHSFTLWPFCCMLPANPNPESILHICFLCNCSQDPHKCWSKSQPRPLCCIMFSVWVMLLSLLLDLSSHSFSLSMVLLQSLLIQSRIQAPPPTPPQDKTYFTKKEQASMPPPPMWGIYLPMHSYFAPSRPRGGSPPPSETNFSTSLGSVGTSSLSFQFLLT